MSTAKMMIWKIRVAIPGRPDFKIAVRPIDGKDTTPLGMIPLKNAAVPAIAVLAQEHKDDIVVNIYSADGYKRGMKCEQLQSLIKKPIASVTAAKGKPVLVASLTSYGIPKLEILPFQSPSGFADGCCGCGTLSCCPNPGRCLDCGDCGSCCQIKIILQ